MASQVVCDTQCTVHHDLALTIFLSYPSEGVGYRCNLKHVKHAMCLSWHVCICVSTERPVVSSITTATTNAPAMRPCPPPHTLCGFGWKSLVIATRIPIESWENSLSVHRTQGSFGEHLGESQLILFAYLFLHAFTKIASLGVLGQEWPMGHCPILEGLSGTVRESCVVLVWNSPSSLFLESFTSSWH